MSGKTSKTSRPPGFLSELQNLDAKIEMAVKPQAPLETSENKEKPEKQGGKKNESMMKVILRRLPPTMTEAELIDQISPLPPHDYFLFVPADYSLAPWTYCRAYVNFTSVEDVILFRDRFDGYVFVDNRGNEYPAIVEMAPCPKVPKKTKRDVKCGTLEDDPEYKAFIELLKNPQPGHLMSLEQCLEEIDKKDKERKENKHAIIPTPLTEFIKQKKEEKLRKKQLKDEERRKRLEREKQMREQEKRRQQREQERKEREAKKESDRSNVPPRFGGKDEGEQEKRKGNAGPPKGKKSTWKDEGSKYYYDEAETSRYHEKRPPKKQPKSKEQAGKDADKHPVGKKTSSFQQEESPAGACAGEKSDRWMKAEEQGSKGETGKRNEPTVKGERQSKSKYKDKPSVPLYQPGRKKSRDEKGDM